MRPKKTRWIKKRPGERCFKPLCKPLNKAGGVYLSLDEFEAMRLADLEGMTHDTAAKHMRISRPTFTRIVSSARKKIAFALVNIKAIHIEGGCCKIKYRKIL